MLSAAHGKIDTTVARWVAKKQHIDRTTYRCKERLQGEKKTGPTTDYGQPRQSVDCRRACSREWVSISPARRRSAGMDGGPAREQQGCPCLITGGSTSSTMGEGEVSKLTLHTLPYCTCLNCTFLLPVTSLDSPKISISAAFIVDTLSRAQRSSALRISSAIW